MANNKIKCVAIVMPNKNHDPKYKEKTVHHIHERICKIRCLTFSSGICFKGLTLELITPCQPFLTNSIIIIANAQQNLYFLILVF